MSERVMSPLLMWRDVHDPNFSSSHSLSHEILKIMSLPMCMFVTGHLQGAEFPSVFVDIKATPPSDCSLSGSQTGVTHLHEGGMY